MLVSIIIPIYNVALYIERCLESVFKQTYQNIEVILIDDCSPDNSIEIANTVIKKYDAYDFTKIIKNNKNKGLSASRNTGINISTGDYIYFLDSDDEISKNCISIMADYAKKYNPDFVVSGVVEIESNNKKYIIPNFDNGEVIFSNDLISDSFFLHKWYIMAWNKLLKKEFILQNKLFFLEGVYHEDMLWSFELANTASSMVACQNITYIYYKNPGSITQVLTLKRIDDMFLIFSKWLEILNHNILNTNQINFIESHRFYLLSLLSNRKDWLVYFDKMQDLNYLSYFSLLKSQASITNKIKRTLQILPSKTVYSIFQILKTFK